MMKQLTAMVAKMGDLGGAADVAASTTLNQEEESGGARPVVKAIGMNVSDLVEVLCGPSNAPLFLKFGSDESQNNENQDNNDQDVDAMNADNNEETANNKGPKAINASEEAGPLATLLLSCAYGLPLQTPSYAALTLGVDVKAPKETHAGFAKRCLELGMRILGRDLDMAVECAVASADGTAARAIGSEDNVEAKMGGVDEQRCTAERSGGYGNGDQIDAYHRAKSILRYLAHLTKVGIVSSSSPEDGNHGAQSLLGLLQMLVQAASYAAIASTRDTTEQCRAMGRSARILSSLVLSTIPYALSQLDGNEKGIPSKALIELVDALENNVVGQTSQYSSDYEPGVGQLAILLKGELDDAPTGSGDDEDDDDEDDDEEEDDEDGDQPAPCADTLQDLLRTVRKMVSSSAETSSSLTRFALLGDAPWTTLTMNAPSTDASEGMEMEGEKVPMAYVDEPLLLDLMGGEEKRCKSIPHLLSLEGAYHCEDAVEVKCRALHGIVLGRLAIFDAPPDLDANDDDGDEEGGDGAGGETNPNLESYVKTFSLVDRFFLSDAVRDVLMCHRPMVSNAGADRSNAKEVAEQIWAISHLFHPPTVVEGDAPSAVTSESSSKGIEYGIIETLLSLIVQCTPQGSSTPSYSPLHQHTYLSRVLLELTKLKPSLIPQAIVLAISGMFEDFLPSLAPSARENLSVWFSFHLINTEYQWPKAFWDHWAPYAAVQRNSRGEFITYALRSMAALSSEGPVELVHDCLPPASPLVQSVFLNAFKKKEHQLEAGPETDLIDRMWNTSEDPDFIRQHIISDELSESHVATTTSNETSMQHSSVWWRTGLATRALFYPYTRESSRLARLIEKAWKQRSNGDDTMADDGSNNGANDEIDESEDLLADVSDAISRFKPVMLAALARDAEMYQQRVESENGAGKDDDQLLLTGEVYILGEVGDILSSSDSVLCSALLECLLKNQIVSGLAVATWVLGEHADSTAVIPTNWWKYVSLAIHNSIAQALSKLEAAKTDLGGGIGMIIDDGGVNDEDDKEAASRRLDEALRSIVPVVTYVVERACHVIAATSSESKKIPPVGADLFEGIKQLVHAVLFHFQSLVLTSSPSLTSQDVMHGFASMDASGEKLASVCQAAVAACEADQGKKLLQNLASSLEKMM